MQIHNTEAKEDGATTTFTVGVETSDEREPHFRGLPHYDSEYHCLRCRAVFSGGDVPDLRCLSCGGETLVEGLLATLEVATPDDDVVRINVRETDAPKFFAGLDDALRMTFGIRLAPLAGCNDAVRQKLDCAENVSA